MPATPSWLLLVRLFQQTPIGRGSAARLGNVGCPTDLFVGGGFTPSPEAEEGLEGGHRLLPAIVSEDKFVEVDLELGLAHSVVRNARNRCSIGTSKGESPECGESAIPAAERCRLMLHKVEREVAITRCNCPLIPEYGPLRSSATTRHETNAAWSQ